MIGRDNEVRMVKLMLESRCGVKERSILFSQYQIPVVAVTEDGGEMVFNLT